METLCGNLPKSTRNTTLKYSECSLAVTPNNTHQPQRLTLYVNRHQLRSKKRLEAFWRSGLGDRRRPHLNPRKQALPPHWVLHLQVTPNLHCCCSHQGENNSNEVRQLKELLSCTCCLGCIWIPLSRKSHLLSTDQGDTPPCLQVSPRPAIMTRVIPSLPESLTMPWSSLILALPPHDDTEQ